MDGFNNDQDQRKFKNIKYLLKLSTTYMMGLGFIGTLTTLPGSKNNIDIFEKNADKLIRVGIISFIGFMFTTILAGLAQEAMEHGSRYWSKALFYWLSGVVLIAVLYIILALVVSIIFIVHVYRHYKTDVVAFVEGAVAAVVRMWRRH
jgi:hypothetical protein